MNTRQDVSLWQMQDLKKRIKFIWDNIWILLNHRCFFAKGIIFVEGISEALLLPVMAKILNRPFDKFAIELVNVNGTSF